MHVHLLANVSDQMRSGREMDMRPQKDVYIFMQLHKGDGAHTGCLLTKVLDQMRGGWEHTWSHMQAHTFLQQLNKGHEADMRS